MCVFFAVVHAALVPAALVLAKLEARRAGARVGVAEPRGDRATTVWHLHGGRMATAW